MTPPIEDSRLLADDLSRRSSLQCLPLTAHPDRLLRPSRVTTLPATHSVGPGSYGNGKISRSAGVRVLLEPGKRQPPRPFPPPRALNAFRTGVLNRVVFGSAPRALKSPIGTSVSRCMASGRELRRDSLTRACHVPLAPRPGCSRGRCRLWGQRSFSLPNLPRRTHSACSIRPLARRSST